MTQNSFQMTSSAVSDRGLSEKRPQNEDSYLEMPEHGLFAVADGVGGAQAGDVASQMAVEILSEAFTNLRVGGDVEELMQMAISRANEAIYQMSHDLPQLSTMATTIVALHVDGNIATIGHAGDSRLYRLDSNGNLLRETQDHSVVEEEVRAGRMTAEQAEYHPSKNVISRALGAESTVEVDMKTIMFNGNTTFLLCSDGVTRHIPDDEISQLLASAHPLPVICQQIKDVCYSRGAEDNLTAVIIRVAANADKTDTDFEENTSASSRPPLVNSAIFADNAPIHNEVATQSLEMPIKDAEAKNLSDSSQISISANPVKSNDASVQTENQTPSMFNNYLPQTEESISHESEKRGVFGRILASLLFLIIGAAIGAAAAYAYLNSQKSAEVPQISQIQTPNIPFSAFENNRRNVDKNPAQYIIASGATAEDAEDYYLLGRAYLLTGKYAEAKDSLAKAKERLPMVTGDDKTMLANEITIGLAIAGNAASQKILETEKNEPVSNVNVNANSTTNMESPANTNATN